jgi:hypothetical protein
LRGQFARIRPTLKALDLEEEDDFIHTFGRLRANTKFASEADIKIRIAIKQLESRCMAKFMRRDPLIGEAATLAATRLPSVAVSRSINDSPSLESAKGEDSMATITTKDGTTIFYKDWGPKDAQPIVFHHGWPLSSDDWDAQMLFLAFIKGTAVRAG